MDARDVFVRAVGTRLLIDDGESRIEAWIAPLRPLEFLTSAAAIRSGATFEWSGRHYYVERSESSQLGNVLQVREVITDPLK